MLHLVSYFKSGFITFSNISERAFCKINQRLKVFNHFCKVLYLGCFARVLSIPLNLTARIAEINLKYTAKNVVISPKFLVWKLCFSSKFPQQEIKWSHDIFGSGSRFNTYRSIEGIWLVYHMINIQQTRQHRMDIETTFIINVHQLWYLVKNETRNDACFSTFI